MKNKTVLIVEDSDIDRTMISQILSNKCGVKVLEARSGDECLEIINRQPIDLILMDIMMPGESGSQILTAIRKKFNAIELPIIMATAKLDTEDVVNCLRDGANDYITKPINFEIAISRVMTHLALSEVSRITSELNQVLALDDMLTTYNQEIISVVSTALSYLNPKSSGDEESTEKLRICLWKISDIVKKLKEVIQQRKSTVEQYSGKIKI